MFFMIRLTITIMTLPESQEYYDWRYKLEKYGIPYLIAEKYYDEDEIYTVSFEDVDYTFSMLTDPKLLHPQTNPNTVKRPDSDEVTQNIDTDRLVETVRKMASINNENPEDITEDDISNYLWNDPTYTVADTSYNTEVSIDTKISDFYSVLSDTQQIVNELDEAILKEVDIGETQLPVRDILANKMPIRDRLFSSLSESLENIGDFNRSVGLTTVTVVKSEDEYFLLLAKRGSEVVSWPNYYSIIPAGYMQKSLVQGDSLTKEQFISMYTNEVFDIETPTGKTPQVKGTAQMLDSTVGDFDVTGVGVEALYLSIQVSAIAIIEYDQYIDYLSEKHNINFESESFELVPFSRLPKVLPNLLDNASLTSPSAFALLNGLEYIKNEKEHIDVPVDFDIKQTNQPSQI